MFKKTQELVYNSTTTESKFLDYMSIQDQLKNFNSEMEKYVDEGTFTEAEYAFVTPNILMYATIAFLLGTKTKKTSEIIDDNCDETSLEFAVLIKELYETLENRDAEI
jgi:hypothetical protein